MGYGGFLSDGPKGQRAFLRGDHDPPSEAAERQTRQRIRDRTKSAIQDLGLVARSHRLDERDRASILARETPAETDDSSAMVEIVRGDDGERSLRYPGTGEGNVVARIPHPVDPDPADPHTANLWGRVGVASEMMSIIELFYRTLREDGATSEEVCLLIAAALEGAEGKHRHPSPIGWRDDVAATVEVETG